MLGGIAGIEHHEPRVVDPAIGILKAGSEHSGLQRPPSPILRQVVFSLRLRAQGFESAAVSEAFIEFQNDSGLRTKPLERPS